MGSTPARCFKTKAFAKLAHKAAVPDADLLIAIAELREDKGTKLGGNVWKKRLNKNMHRCIVVEKIGERWIFVFMYAKQDRDNLTQAEEQAFKLLAKQYKKMSDVQLKDLLAKQELLEITNHGN